jgi:hypothetical protein
MLAADIFGNCVIDRSWHPGCSPFMQICSTLHSLLCGGCCCSAIERATDATRPPKEYALVSVWTETPVPRKPRPCAAAPRRKAADLRRKHLTNRLMRAEATRSVESDARAVFLPVKSFWALRSAEAVGHGEGSISRQMLRSDVLFRVVVSALPSWLLLC